MESDESSRTRGGVDGRFWNELYWFITISLIGGMIALWVIPPRGLETLSLLEKETELERAVSEARGREETLEAAKAAALSDPYYRDRLRRALLNVKREGEEVLDLSSP